MKKNKFKVDLSKILNHPFINCLWPNIAVLWMLDYVKKGMSENKAFFVNP